METNKAAGTAREARLMAGIPAIHAGIYRRIRFSVGDPVAVVDLPKVDGTEVGGASRVGAWETTLILRDIEMDRARRQARVDRVHCPRDFAPAGGLSGDRETATAQAAAECVRRSGCVRVVVDRSLPAIYSEMLHRAAIAVRCDTEWGIVERRQKDPQEIAWIAEAQGVTESVMERACRTIAGAQADRDGYLLLDGSPLTSERMMRLITGWLLDAGYSNPGSIVAGGPVGADCHDHGHGPLRTGQPVIVDIYPKNQTTLYNGDCTRTVVHGQIPDPVAAMHRAVVAAKKAAIATIRAGVTGEQVHRATLGALAACGYQSGFPPAGSADEIATITHGTGHGIGLDVHEPPLLDLGGPELRVGECVTVEPGLYAKAYGGVRVEDIVVVTEEGCQNLNRLPEGLCWGD